MFPVLGLLVGGLGPDVRRGNGFPFGCPLFCLTRGFGRSGKGFPFGCPPVCLTGGFGRGGKGLPFGRPLFCLAGGFGRGGRLIRGSRSQRGPHHSPAQRFRLGRKDCGAFQTGSGQTSGAACACFRAPDKRASPGRLPVLRLAPPSEQGNYFFLLSGRRLLLDVLRAPGPGFGLLLCGAHALRPGSGPAFPGFRSRIPGFRFPLRLVV